MNAGPVDVRPSTVKLEPSFEAEQTGDTHLGPISPELVLVDPLLASQARKLLPDPHERPRSRLLDAGDQSPSVPLPERPEVSVAPVALPRRHRWQRTVVLAGLVFAAGAAFGGLLGERRSTSSGVALKVQSAGRGSSTRPGGGKSLLGQPPSIRRRSAPRPRWASGKSLRGATTSAPQQRGKLARLSWSANVLGVAAQVAGPGVKLIWQRPADSGHVVVLRTLGDRGRSTTVFRGRATTFRDLSPRPCTAYRYTIVNYDRRGHRSTGVPTSVVTEGCT